jgi:3-oxoacyl-[acyl-carrier protein] reductase
MNFLITGGASGLGYAITKTIAARFPDSVIWFTFCSSAATAKSLEEEYKNVHSVKCDFRDKGDIEKLCQFIQSSEIDVLVNNAITKLTKQYFHKTDKSVYGESFNADVISTLEITQSFILKARERKFGKIITILTSALLNAPPTGWSVYLANKAYLLAMHKSWATENKAFNITSNCISPDFMATPLNDQTDERVIENLIKAHPLKKLLTVEEVAEVVLFLCNSSAQLNGQNIFLNSAMNF